MKLKELLREVADDESFLALFDKYDLIVPKLPLYRGFKRRSYDTWEMVPIRQDRTPKTTSQLMDNLAEAARLFYEPDLPSRRSSAFVTASESYASKYGTVHYVFFQKSANVAWWDSDTFPAYLRSKPQTIRNFNENTIIQEILDSGKFPNVGAFLSSVESGYETKWKLLLSKKFKTVHQELRELKRAVDDRVREEMKIGGIGNRPDAYALMGLNSTLLSWDRALGKVKQYVKEAKDYRPTETGKLADVMIEDKWIIAVNKDWFDSNFEMDSPSQSIRRK